MQFANVTIDATNLQNWNFYFFGMVAHSTFCQIHFFFLLSQWGVPKIHIITVVASRAGLELLSKTHPDISVTVGMVDERLTECGVVLPGLGDVGDRLFGTGNYDFDQAEEETPIAATSSAASAASEDSGSQPNRRKRSASLQLEMEHASKK